MNQPDAKTAPNYVICPCQHCGGNIEFDANQLDATEIPTVPCPHCELQTTIFVPKEDTSPVNYTEEEMKWVFKGAKLGDLQCVAGLGAAYLLGTGIPKNYTEAFKWLRQAAEQGNVNAQSNLGVCYFHGYGAAQSFVEAEKWFRKAAEREDSSAQYHLGCLYQLGQGVSQNFFKAFTWWLKAAEHGDVIAQNNVGFIYGQGEIIAQDYIEAYKWTSLAADQGFEGADKDADAIALKMSAAQREESLRRIKAFKSKNTEQKQLQDESIIGRLAKLGDLEAQAIVLAKENLEAANGELIHIRRAISSEVRREVWRRDEGKCVKCGSRERLEYDHIIPVSKGGSNTARNIELLYENCNRTKSDSIQ
jgi:TPR repeat protein